MQFVYLVLILIFVYYLIKLLRGEAIFVPLPEETIEKMLRLAGVSSKDVVYDLGSGDGRVIILAVKKFKCRAVGIEKNPILYFISKFRIRKQNLQKLVEVKRKNFFDEDLSKSTVIFIYLSKKIVNKLREKFEKELKKGTRIVSADHRIKGWRVRRRIKTGHFYSYLYMR
jgi:predicted RNA methylase